MTVSIVHNRLFLVAQPAEFHVGGHLLHAASQLGLATRVFDTAQAFGSWPLLRSLNWKLLGRRPALLNRFGNQVVQACCAEKPMWLLTTGIAPLSESALITIGKMGVQRLNYLTDDPFNPAHHAPWFLRALPHYDVVLTPRTANINELREHGCSEVRFLPFAYSPNVHYIQTPTAAELRKLSCDIMFAGAADQERVRFVSALIEAGFDVALYGSYWERYARTRRFARGHADLELLRKATTAAKLVLCMVRRANRDDNSMRTFEIPAMGGCILADDTPFHRSLFGDGATYFRNVTDLIPSARSLLNDEQSRQQLVCKARETVYADRHSYSDRLAAALSLNHTRVTNRVASHSLSDTVAADTLF